MVRQAGSEGHKSRFLQLTDVGKSRDRDDAAQDLSNQAPASHHIPVRSKQPLIFICSFSVQMMHCLKTVASSHCISLPANLSAHVQLQVEDVITQVTRRDQLPAANRTAPYPKATEQDGVDSRITWKTKLRSLLCCLAPPQNDQYFRSNEAEAVVIRPPRAVVPPPRAPGDCYAACYCYTEQKDHAQLNTLLQLIVWFCCMKQSCTD